MKNAFAPISKFIATGGYSGYMSAAPGTVGTIVAAVVLFFCYSALPELGTTNAKVAVALLLIAVSIASSNSFLQSEYPSGENKDPQMVVIDEWAGFAVALIAVGSSWQEFFLAFVFFRIFDITKPPPARQAESLPGGLGITLDDVTAGIYAAVCCWFWKELGLPLLAG